MFLRWYKKDLGKSTPLPIYAIDSNSGFSDFDDNIVLMKMGKYMEKMMVEEAHEFTSKYVINDATGKVAWETPSEPEYYNYSVCGRTLLRS